MVTNKARESILGTASKLFYEHGVRAVGVDRIIEESGVAKATFYNHFRSKDDLVAATLEARDPEVRRWLTSAAEKRAERDGTHPALALFDVLGDWFASRSFNGCAFVRTSLELIDNERVRGLASEHKLRAEAWFAQTLIEEGARKATAQSHARMLMLLFDGAIVRARIDNDPTVAGQARAAAAVIMGSELRRR